MRLNKSGNRRGQPGVKRTRAHRQKPCVICREPIVRPYPSQLVKVTAHKACQGALLILRRAQSRKARLVERWRSYPVEIRLALVEAYRDGARETAERLRVRARCRALAKAS